MRIRFLVGEKLSNQAQVMWKDGSFCQITISVTVLLLLVCSTNSQNFIFWFNSISNNSITYFHCFFHYLSLESLSLFSLFLWMPLKTLFNTMGKLVKILLSLWKNRVYCNLRLSFWNHETYFNLRKNYLILVKKNNYP